MTLTHTTAITPIDPALLAVAVSIMVGIAWTLRALLARRGLRGMPAERAAGRRIWFLILAVGMLLAIIRTALLRGLIYQHSATSHALIFTMTALHGTAEILAPFLLLASLLVPLALLGLGRERARMTDVTLPTDLAPTDVSGAIHAWARLMDGYVVHVSETSSWSVVARHVAAWAADSEAERAYTRLGRGSGRGLRVGEIPMLCASLAFWVAILCVVGVAHALAGSWQGARLLSALPYDLAAAGLVATLCAYIGGRAIVAVLRPIRLQLVTMDLQGETLHITGDSRRPLGWAARATLSALLCPMFRNESWPARRGPVVDAGGPLGVAAPTAGWAPRPPNPYAFQTANPYAFQTTSSAAREAAYAREICSYRRGCVEWARALRAGYTAVDAATPPADISYALARSSVSERKMVEELRAANLPIDVGLAVPTGSSNPDPTYGNYWPDAAVRVASNALLIDIEADGVDHRRSERVEADRRRDRRFKERGWYVVHVDLAGLDTRLRGWADGVAAITWDIVNTHTLALSMDRYAPALRERPPTTPAMGSPAHTHAATTISASSANSVGATSPPVASQPRQGQGTTRPHGADSRRPRETPSQATQVSTAGTTTATAVADKASPSDEGGAVAAPISLTERRAARTQLPTV